MFPLSSGSTILQLSSLDNKELVEESWWTAYKSFDDFAEAVDLWDESTTRFLLVDPPSGKVEDVTKWIARELVWYTKKKGWIDPYQPDDGFPAWAVEAEGFYRELEAAVEALRQPEPEKTERLRKEDLL